MSDHAEMLEAKPTKELQTVTVTVNGKPVTLEQHTKVSVVLDKSGYDSSNHYLVRVEHDREVQEFRDTGAPINLHEGEEFRAYYTDVTPLS